MWQRSRKNDGQRQYNEQSYTNNDIQCHHCKRYGHIKADCWYKDQKMNFATETEEENKFFMACIEVDQKPSDLWFLDSGCSNHMIDIKSLFKELDETKKIKVQLGNIKEIQVEGKGTVQVHTSHDKAKMLDNVHFVPDLGYNLLSVRQLMASEYSILFYEDACVITNKKSGKQVHVIMTPNKMFPLDVSNIDNFALTTSAKDDSKL